MQKEAIEKHGAQQVLWLYGPDHMVTEVGTMNMFMFWKNENGGWFNNKILLKDVLQGNQRLLRAYYALSRKKIKESYPIPKQIP